MIKKYLEINNLRTAYFDEGAGEVVLFLHGGVMDALTFEKTILFLSKKFRVIAVDIPCFGESETPEEIWSFYDYAEFFKVLMKQLNINKYSIVGHSMGGGIGLHVALNNSEVDKLILVSSAGIEVDYSTVKFLYQLFVKKLLNEALLSGSPDIIQTQAKGGLRSLKNHPDTILHIIKIIEKCLRGKTPDLNNVKSKTLILWGDEDELLPLEYAKELNKGIKKSKLKVFKGNHSWCMFDGKTFHNEILKFLK